ncbi:MAG: competence/damage-inducible protein A [Turicibacter sp.]|nr:competence/damage-inducible protein A [Turicibacter sp.]
MNIAIVAVGNEVLCGQIVNTNSSYIALEVEQLGAVVAHQQVVPDNVEAIKEAMETAYRYADVVLTVGGLGPTVDDLTRHGVAGFFGEDLVLDEPSLQGIEDFYKRINRTMSPNNKQQAYGFSSGRMVPNPRGTAPGLFLEKDGRAVFLLPGPPDELKPMVQNHVLPYIEKRLGDKRITQTYRLYGIGESAAEIKILDLYERYPQLNIAPYASISYTDYVVSTPQKHEGLLKPFHEDFHGILGGHIVGERGVPIAETIVGFLKRHSLTLATAESCTGGMLASELVNVPGVSDVFLEGMVTYTNEAKMKRLGVKAQTLQEHGAVSEECVREMAEGLRAVASSDFAVAISGIAGPTGGTDEKPVGLCHLAVATPTGTETESFIFPGDREKIRIRTTSAALYLIFRCLKAI